MSNLPPHGHVFGAGPSMHHGGPTELRQPKLWILHLVYCVLLGLVYAACLVGAVAYIFFFRDTVAASEIPSEGLAQLDITAAVAGVLSVPLAAGFLSAPFLPRKPWAWTVHLVLVCVGLTSACCLPVCIPILIQWLKPETKAWFGRR